MRTRGVEQIGQQPAADTAIAHAFAHAQIQDVAFASPDAQDAMAHDDTTDLEHTADVTDAQAVTKNAFAPRELVGRAFDVDDASVFLVVANNGIVRLNREATSDKANDERLIVPEPGVTSIGLTGDFVYYTTPKAVKRVPKSGCP